MIDIYIYQSEDWLLKKSYFTEMISDVWNDFEKGPPFQSKIIEIKENG